MTTPHATPPDAGPDLLHDLRAVLGHHALAQSHPSMQKLVRVVFNLARVASQEAYGDGLKLFAAAVAKEACKPGQTAASTGCTPASGESAGQPASPAADPTSASEAVKAHVLDAFAKGSAAYASAKEAALRFGESAFQALPAPAQAVLAKTWGAARYVEHKVMIGFHKTRAVAVQAARERGLSEEQAATLGKVLGAIDLVSAWTVNMPATLAATGSLTLAKVSSWVPVASLAYLAYSTSLNPLATARAARKVLAGQVKRFARLVKGADALAGELARRMQVAGPHADWYLALFSAALDQGQDPSRALAAADAGFAVQPADPSRGRELSEEDCDPFAADAPAQKAVTKHECKPGQTAAAGTLPDALIELPNVRQDTHWSCGAMSAMAVGRHFGVGPETKEEWIAALGTSEAKSTSAAAIAGYLRRLGLAAEERHGMTPDDLAACWRAGRPVIVCCQDYMSVNAGLDSAWDYGHWMVFVGGPAFGYVWFQDSSADNALGRPGGTVTDPSQDSGSDAAPGKVMIALDDWLRVWHDVGEDGTEYVRYGICVGPAAAGEPARPHTVTKESENEGETDSGEEASGPHTHGA